MSGSDASASDDELWEVEKIVDQRFEDEERGKFDGDKCSTKVRYSCSHTGSRAY